MVLTLNVETRKQGLTEITEKISAIVDSGDYVDGLCTVMVQHTSASLIIQENADPSAKRDLEVWLNKLVPENDSLYTHTLEGSDDMPAHIKSVMTQTTMGIPFQNKRLLLGTWQGIYLWEHRHGGSNRKIVIHIGK